MNNTLNSNSINTVNLNSNFMNTYFKSDIEHFLYVLQQEREEQLLAVSYKQMNKAVTYGYKEVDVVPFDPLVHFNTLTVNWGRPSFIRMDEEKEFVDLSNQWQVITTNEPITSIKGESNN